MERTQDIRQRLEAYLKAKFPQREELSIVEMDQLTAGVSRDNYLVTTTWREAQGPVSESLIIQMDLGFCRSGQEYDFSRQYEVLKRVHGTGIPVAKVYWVEMDSQFLGHPFAVMEKIEGEVLATFYTNHPEHQVQLVKDYVSILAKIHGLDWQALGLSFLSVAENAFRRPEEMVARWQQLVEDNQYSPQPVIAELLNWLKRNMPQPERTTLCHGDYHLRNILVRDGRIVALLDWEGAGISDPMRDLGWACMFLTVGYGGFCDETEFIRAYEEMAGVKVNKESLLFWKVSSFVGLTGVGLAGIKVGIESKELDMRQLGIWTMLVPRLQDQAAQLLGF